MSEDACGVCVYVRCRVNDAVKRRSSKVPRLQIDEQGWRRWGKDIVIDTLPSIRNMVAKLCVDVVVSFRYTQMLVIVATKHNVHSTRLRPTMDKSKGADE